MEYLGVRGLVTALFCCGGITCTRQTKAVTSPRTPRRRKRSEIFWWRFDRVADGDALRARSAIRIPIVERLRASAIRNVASQRPRCALQHRLRQSSARLQGDRPALPKSSRWVPVARRERLDQDAL